MISVGLGRILTSPGRVRVLSPLGSGQPPGGLSPGDGNLELREDGGFELREDGGLEERE
jgi:hypothetical protein